MSWGRILSAAAVTAAVGGCAVVAVGMSQAGRSAPAADRGLSTSAAPTSRPAYLPPAPAAGGSSARATAPTSATRRSVAISTARRPAGTAGAPTAIIAASAATRAASADPRAAVAPAQRPVSKPPASPRSAAKPTPKPVSRPAAGSPLPLRYSTGVATKVLTVVARSAGSTTATVQAWTKVAAGRWTKRGGAVAAHVGSDGLSARPSEARSATPVGSFTLTQAFGRNADPGTGLPYTRTTPSDWWVSQPGRLYNTRQRCASGCAFTTGAPNEHLYYETPYYDYAVVIDYNTRNAPGGVRQGEGSAFFLHVTDGTPTAGCVAISRSKLVSLMRWLSPAAHPRILIGVA